MKHVAAATGLEVADAQRYIDGAINGNNARFAVNFAQKRQNAKDRILREKIDAPSADTLLKDITPFEFCKGKLLLGQIMNDMNAGGVIANKLITEKTDALYIKDLQEFSDRAWGRKSVEHESTVGDVTSLQADAQWIARDQ